MKLDLPDQDPDYSYPPPPTDGTFEDLKRYANILMIAQVEAGTETAMLGVPIGPSAELWERAGRIYDRMQRIRAEEAALAQSLEPLAILHQHFAEDQFPSGPDELARAKANFDAAREACRTGHEAGCTYGGTSALHGYWISAQECTENHGEVCDLRMVCLGARAQHAFNGDEGAWLWQVSACEPCSEQWRSIDPRWHTTEEQP